MHPRTEATIQELREAAWFSAVGAKDTDAARVVSSWKEAIKLASSQSWEDLCLEAVNQYCSHLAERAPDRFDQWNDLVDQVKLVSIPLVDEKTQAVARKNRLPKSFSDTVQWDILHVCMEAEYADVFPAGFYASQAYWYVRGHFPCGWEGRFPSGRLIIY